MGAVTWGSATFNPTQFVLQSATTNTNGNSSFLSAINLNGADRTIRSEQTSGTTGNGTFSGVISNSTGTAGLIKNGVGHLTLSNTNTYNGSTTITQGILTANSTGALGNSSADGHTFNQLKTVRGHQRQPRRPARRVTGPPVDDARSKPTLWQRMALRRLRKAAGRARKLKSNADALAPERRAWLEKMTKSRLPFSRVLAFAHPETPLVALSAARNSFEPQVTAYW